MVVVSLSDEWVKTKKMICNRELRMKIWSVADWDEWVPWVMWEVKGFDQHFAVATLSHSGSEREVSFGNLFGIEKLVEEEPWVDPRRFVKNSHSWTLFSFGRTFSRFLMVDVWKFLWWVSRWKLNRVPLDFEHFFFLVVSLLGAWFQMDHPLVLGAASLLWIARI